MIGEPAIFEITPTYRLVEGLDGWIIERREPWEDQDCWDAIAERDDLPAVGAYFEERGLGEMARPAIGRIFAEMLKPVSDFSIVEHFQQSEAERSDEGGG